MNPRRTFAWFRSAAASVSEWFRSDHPLAHARGYTAAGLFAAALVSGCSTTGEKSSGAQRIVSPDGKIAAEFSLTPEGAPRYTVRRDGQVVLQESRLGLVRDDADFTSGLKLLNASRTRMLSSEYEILTSKRRLNTYTGNHRVFELQASGGQKLNIIFQVSNDGVAFRYYFPETDARKHTLKEEVSSFHFLPETRAWLQPMSIAKTGWSQVNPCYEEYYEKDIAAGTPSPLAGWVYPALFRSGDTWLLVSEGSLPRNYCGTRLRAQSPDGEYSVGFPDSRENFQNGAVNPESTLPWLTPWRIIAVGSLKTIAESTLGTDLADSPGSAEKAPVPIANPPYEPVVPLSERDVNFNDSRNRATLPRNLPGKASWSWPLMGDAKTTFDVQKRFIDYAADMHWRYCLIDSMWDQQIGYEKMKELVDYAKTKKVAILVWYNSAGDWCAAPQTPRNMMLTHESRIKEFKRLKGMGIAGMKIDFFGGDGQSQINYYHDILTDAAPYGFAMNFHGATLPRGWNRTFPQLMTMEAIKGLEFCTFEQKNADEEPAHAATLPFTRNIFDPMDFTPVVLDKIPRIERRTTSAFELALSVVFTSGITHYAEIPEGMAKAPDYVRDFLRNVPGIWDDTKFIDGYPGKFVVLARRGGNRWYLAAINGENTEKKLTLDLSGLEKRYRGSGDLYLQQLSGGTLILDGDGGNLAFRREAVSLANDTKLEITLRPHGGAVGVLE